MISKVDILLSNEEELKKAYPASLCTSDVTEAAIEKRVDLRTNQIGMTTGKVISLRGRILCFFCALNSITLLVLLLS